LFLFYIFKKLAFAIIQKYVTIDTQYHAVRVFANIVQGCALVRYFILPRLNDLYVNGFNGCKDDV